MKYNKKMLLKTFVALFVLTCLLTVPGVAVSQDFAAILVVHGSNDSSWNNQVVSFVNSYNQFVAGEPSLKLNGLAFLYFGNEIQGVSLPNVVAGKLEDVVNTLKNNFREFLFVHLSPSSYSVRHNEIATRVSPLIPHPLQYAISSAMDGHPLAIEILRARAASQPVNAGTKSLILVGYGPIAENQNNLWEDQLRTIGNTISNALNFQNLVCINLRYHAEDSKRSRAVKRLRKDVKALTKNGTVVVIPYVLCDGSVSQDSFHKDLHDYLWGVDRNTSGNVEIAYQGVISHANTKEWVKRKIEAGMTQPVRIKPVNKTWSAMEALKKSP